MAGLDTISGLVPIDRDGHPIQVLMLGASVADDVDGTSDSSALPSGATEGEIVRIACSQDTYIKFGGASVTAAATDILMPAGVEYLQVPANSGYLAYLQVSTAGRISITLMQ